MGKSSQSNSSASGPAAAGDKAATPAMRQFHQFKKQHPECVLFFRMGDFYEMFYDDAKLAHKVLGVTLTQRTEGVPMAGVPYHAVEGYLRRMIQAGYRVAVCDQVEDAAQAKGVVKRDVTRLVTPGTLTDEALLDEGRDNPLAAVMFTGKTLAASGPGPVGAHGDQARQVVVLAWAELSTGVVHVMEVAEDQLAGECARVGPRELLYVKAADDGVPARVQGLGDALDCSLVGRPAWQFRQREAISVLCKQYQVASMAGFGFDDDDPVLAPVGAIIAYLLETQCTDRRDARLTHLQPPRRFEHLQHLRMDPATLRSLEIERTLRSGDVRGSLLGTITHCRTPMGKRLLRHWLCYPLRDKQAIEARQRIVAMMIDDGELTRSLGKVLDRMHDVPRIAARLAVGRATPRDLVALGQSAALAGELALLLVDQPAAVSYHAAIDGIALTLTDLAQHIEAACVDAPPAHMREGGLIRDGYDAQLDEYRSLQRDSDAWLANYQSQLASEIGMTNLKVGYNKVFGFYIELTAAQRDKAPDDWTRKQTLKNAERFITPQLKEYENKVLSAGQRAVTREQELFAALSQKAEQHTEALHELSRCAADLDVLMSFAVRATRHRYVRPIIDEDACLHIVAGRHPVLDEMLGDQFVPNDVALGRAGQGPHEESSLAESSRSERRQTEGRLAPSDHSEGDRGKGSQVISGQVNPGRDEPAATLALITGPNMAGKSTYIRQSALIALLAHTGSYVPADHATVGLLDGIFTRVGASDELHAGQSTFMVEMTETAHICHHATERSLVILDEIGRGTSTLDGLSLAWALTEFFAQRKSLTLFATHYHEMTQLAEHHAQIVNRCVAVREWQDQIVFLHRIEPGRSDRSYGIHVAKLAGVPQPVIRRANELLGQMEVSHRVPSAAADQALTAQASASPAPPPAKAQLALFTEYVEHPVLEQLRQLELDALSPLAAFDQLRRLRDQVVDQPDA